MAKKIRNYVVMSINDQWRKIKGNLAFMMLADYLRSQSKLPGTKIVCAEGDCGACTVLIYDPSLEQALFLPINSCIMPVYKLDGYQILTVESLKENGRISTVQEAIVKHHGSQCGFCTPGFVMALTALYEKKKAPSEQEIKNATTGNLCRCTGYRQLIDAALFGVKDIPSLTERFTNRDYRLLRESREIPLFIKYRGFEMFAPKTLSEAIAFKNEKPMCRIVGGATDLGVQSNKGKISLSSTLSLHLIDEFRSIAEDDERITVGATVTLEEVRQFTKHRIPEFSSFLNIFASPQIKHVASLVGNVANASPIGDTLPFLLVADALVHISGLKGKRIIHLSNLFRGYKELSLEPDEIIEKISFQKLKSGKGLSLLKVSQRKDLDISTVNGAFFIELDPHNKKTTDVRLALGGVNATVDRLRNVENILLGASLSKEIIEKALAAMQKDIAPINDLRGSEFYRRTVANTWLHRILDEGMHSNGRET